MIIDLEQYDHYIVFFSGGKDSFALVGLLLDAGVPKDKIELWHHCIDGKGSTFMDWECTEDYCRKVAQALGLKIYFSWREGGFETEMTKENEKSKGYYFETPDGLKHVPSSARPNTRMKFPQVTADLRTRWCSSSLKIDVSRVAINNQDRFLNKKVIVLSGERGEESPARAKYNMFEPHNTDNRDGKRVVRHVDHWRPIRDWTEQEVWDMMKKYKVRPHPAYELGWGRVSCKFCIFGNKNQFASGKKVSPQGFDKISMYEELFDHTIKRDKSVKELAKEGQTYAETSDKELVKVATSKEYTLPIIVDNWKLPAGAFGELAGPT